MSRALISYKGLHSPILFLRLNMASNCWCKKFTIVNADTDRIT
jgi:hypothetical protein